MKLVSRLLLTASIMLFLALTLFALGLQENSKLPSSANEDPLLQKTDKVKSLIEEGSYMDAEKAAREILAEAETKHGAYSLQVAQVIDVLVEAIISSKRQVDDGSQALIERATTIREEILGPDHSDIAQSLHNFARLYWRSGAYAESAPLFKRALVVAEKAYSPGHIEVSNILNDYGLFLRDNRQFEEARAYLERTLAIREKALGSEAGQTAIAAHNLASLLHAMGAYADAKVLYERVVPILEKEFGPEHPKTADGWNDLGYLLKDMGEYTRAMQCLERALAIREKAFGPEDPAVAHSMNRLAVVFRRTGDYERARKLLERCLEIYEKAFGPEDSNVAMILNNLANVLDNLGDVKGAEAYIKRAFEIQEKALGPENMGLAPYLVNYAVELKLLGKFDQAMELQLRALKIYEKNLGQDHPDISTILINLASLYHERNEDKKAIAAMERAQRITTKAAGPDHPILAQILRLYSKYLLYAGELEGALENSLRSEEILRNHLQLISKSLSEREALAFASAFAYLGFDISLSLIIDHPNELEGAVAKVWDAYIQSRALVLDEMATRHRIIAEIGDLEANALADSLALSRQRLSNIIVRGPDPEMPREEYQKLLDKAKDEKEKAERALAEVSSSFQRKMEMQRAGFTEVRASLPHGFVLVAFAYYYHLGDEETPSYLAFILDAEKATPAVVPLGKAEDIEPLLFDWGQEVRGGTRLPGRSLAEAEDAYRISGETLRRKIWDPIAPHLEDAKCILVVPDGPFHQVNFSALPLGSKQYLIEVGPPIHYLSAERDIISSASIISGRGLLALGAPDFDDTSLFAALSPENSSTQGFVSKVKSLLTFRGSLSECEDLKSLEFAPLPATNKEVNTITDIWEESQEDNGDVLELTGARASEGIFKFEAPGKHTLHIATHGFYLGGDCPSGENPLLSSGLAFAGVNHRKNASPEEDDGILTAEEVANIDLSGTDLVVLSACSSAAGDVMSGEGVFGLRRAFHIAGAQTLIVSLWAVEDEATRDWMQKLYRTRFGRGLPIAESVHTASLETLKELRQKKQNTHPFYWAGLVASGDWR